MYAQCFTISKERASITSITAKLGIAVGTVYTIMHEDLGVQKVCAKFVSHSLTPEQKEQSVRREHYGDG